MKALIQIPLLILTLIAYVLIAWVSPASLGIKQSPREIPMVQTSSEEPVAEVATEPSVELPKEGDLVDDQLPAPDAAPKSIQEAATPSSRSDHSQPIFSLKLASGSNWGLTVGELLIMVALLLLFVEIFKSTRINIQGILDHVFSTFVFIGHLVLFLVWDRAGTGVFSILTVITMLDVLAGFTVSIPTARRDIAFGNNM